MPKSWSELSWANVTKPNVELPPPPQETVYRAGHWDQEQALQPGTLEGDCASAKVLFQRGDVEDAEKVYHWLAGRAEKEKNVEVMEEALYYEAECLYARRKFPKARDTYAKLLNTFPSSRYRGEAVQRQFEIAEHWLQDTREAMDLQKEVDEGKRWFVMPTLVHFEPEKPTFDEEGFCEKAFMNIYVQDPSGPTAPHALYRAGGINFFRERYQEADTYYSLLVEQYPRSPLAPAALELAIQSKINVVGGPDHDARKLTEARELVDRAMRGYPELREKEDFLNRTLYNINEQQAAKDFGIAEFYKRTKHPGAAYFYYEIVRRRYPGTTWADKATARLHELRDAVETEAAKR
jgi:outer membrane protein assembly factor BamD (BamD/ComL family)